MAYTKSKTHNMKSWQYYTLVAAATLALALGAETDPNKCCSTCLTLPTGVVDYDSLVFAQCDSKQSGITGRVCCFNCATTGEPQYDTSSISYDTDGTTPTTKAGTWVKFTWANIQNVSYLALAENQKKTATPTLKDPMAQQASGYFMICAKAKGSLVFRGFGSDSCKTVSLEKKITVLDGDGSTCDARAPDAPIVENDGGVAGCNLNRASVKTVDGKKVCECVSDWAGPPACDQMPTWKWVITIGGGIAALFSIVISVRAFMKSREKKLHEQEALDGAGHKSDVETLHIGPLRNRSLGSNNTPQQTKYANYDHPEDEYSVQKVNNREFSL